MSLTEKIAKMICRANGENPDRVLSADHGGGNLHPLWQDREIDALQIIAAVKKHCTQNGLIDCQKCGRKRPQS